MQNGSHSFTCHPHVYQQMERTILPLLRKHSSDGATVDRGIRHLITAYYSFIDHTKKVKAALAWLVDL